MVKMELQRCYKQKLKSLKIIIYKHKTIDNENPSSIDY